MNQDIILGSGLPRAIELQSSLFQPDRYLFLLLPVFASDFYNAVPGFFRQCYFLVLVNLL